LNFRGLSDKGNMNKIAAIILLIILCIACDSPVLIQEYEFKPRSSTRIKDEMVVFFENYKWQYTETERRLIIAATKKVGE
jgi:hypothetical protein